MNVHKRIMFTANLLKIFKHPAFFTCFKLMIHFYACEDDGFVEKNEWQPHYWINVDKPDDTDCEFICSEWGVPHSFVENVADVDERPRFEREDGWLLTIMRIPVHDPAGPMLYHTVPLGIMTKGEYIITLCFADSEMIPDFIDHSNRRHITVDNQPDFVLRLIYSSTYWFLSYLKQINDTVSQYTRQLERSVRNEALLTMMQLQKALVYFNTSLQGNRLLVDRLNKVFSDDCDADLLEDVEIELSQAVNTVNVYMEILSNSMDTFASVISNNVNAIMKTMTSLSVILMVPTLVASFYGMNVDVWFGSVPAAFGFIILISFGLAAVVWYFLRRARWI